MLNSFFLLASNGDIIIEKHYKRVISRNVIEQLVTEINKNNPEEIIPILSFPKHIIVQIYRDSLFYVGVVTYEVPPMVVVEFLHRVADIFLDYFGNVNEFSIKDNFVTVYELLEELMDYGFPLTTEPNILKEMILPPTIINKAVSAVTGPTALAKLPSGSMSSIPWRKAGVKYTSNEVYFDIIEEVDAIIENNGNIVSSEIDGQILANCHLSGMPDLSMSFINARILDDARLHPCIRINKFERDRVLSFVPPDGNFKLIAYKVNTGSNAQLPISVRPQIFFSQGSGKIDISVGTRNSGGKPVENVVITVPMPDNVASVNVNVNHGTTFYDSQTKKLKWNVGRIPKEKVPMLGGTVAFLTGTQADGNPVITAEFKINGFALSGLKIDSLQVLNEPYRPYKGVRSITQAGKFQIRS